MQNINLCTFTILLMPDVDSTLRSIARWKYLITSDLTNAFYQIPLSNLPMAYIVAEILLMSYLVLEKSPGCTIEIQFKAVPLKNSNLS